MPAPLYTNDTCPNPAYQLDWSYTLFWHAPPPDETWLEPLQTAMEPDGVRILQHQLTAPKTGQFLVSTKPAVPPKLVAQRVKGRLQHILRPRFRNAFQRNYALRSVGSANRQAIDAYIASQLEHHPMADPRVADRFRDYQFHDESIDLSQSTRTSHAIYWYNLHLVFVNDERYRDIDAKRNQQRCTVIRKTAAKKGHRLSRIGVLPDHVHLALRADLRNRRRRLRLGI